MSANWSPKKWTADEDAVLMRMRERGFSFGEIAIELPGRTRNMVVGRADRLGLCKSSRITTCPECGSTQPPNHMAGCSRDAHV